MQEDYARLFSAAFRALKGKGIRFEALARQVLGEVIGGGSSEALLALIGGDSLQNPEAFANRLIETLADGGFVVCNLMEREASERVLSSSSIPEIVEFEALARKSSSRVSAMPKPKPVSLHDHRIRDELEEYRGRLEE
ncbi:MAG TPA: hypothetical protein VGR56_09830 [Nitrososphaerales archaeon]|nr:hypothetical protein [Nitrososphaerales archaeon]